jgi:hypothetical protein
MAVVAKPPALGSVGLPGRVPLRNVLLAGGVAAPVLYAAGDVLGWLAWRGYSPVAQHFSELIATGAPSRPVVAPIALVYSVLVVAFGAGVWRSAGPKRALRGAAVGLVGKEVEGFAVAAYFPMHMREVLAAGGATLSDTLHVSLTFVGVGFILLAMVSGATAFGKRFLIFTIGTIAALVVGGYMGAADAPRIAANLPTPWAGAWERLNIYGFLVWVLVLAVTLLRAEAGRDRARPA